MSRKLYDLAVKTGQYTTPSGESKAVWQNVGSVFEGNNGGQFILLARWFNPAGVPDLSGKGGDSVILSCFEPRQDGQRPQPQQAKPQQKPAPRAAARPAPQPVAADDEDVPF